MSKIGRNEPCPCGSGKKYKKCCLSIDTIVNANDTLFNRYNNLLTLVKLKLEEAYAKEIKQVRKEARQLFLQYSTSNKLLTEHESLFSDWLWFDKTDSDDDTLGFHYLQVNSPHINPMLSAALTALSVSYLSIYEILGMEDEFLLVKDIFNNYQAKVLVGEPYTPKNKSLLLGRLILLPEGHVFSGIVLIMEDTDHRREFLNSHFEYIKDATKETIPNILKFRGNMLFGLFDHAYHKIMINLNDIRYAPINKENYNLLSEGLNNNENFKHLYDVAAYQWFAPLNSNKGYVKIALAKENIIICADVMEDIDYLQETIDSIIPNLVFTIIGSTFIRQTPESEVFGIWFTAIKDQEADKWLKTPMRDLKNKTPLEILAEKEGKNLLLSILNTLENTDNTKEQNDFLAYVKARINIFLT